MSFDALPHNYLTWTESAVSLSYFLRYNIYRRESGTTAWVRLKVISDRALTFYQDYTAESDVLYEYAVTQVQSINGEEIESDFPTPVTVTLVLLNVFLHDVAAPEHYVQVKARALDVTPEQDIAYVIPWGRNKPTAHIGNKLTSVLSLDVYRDWETELDDVWEELQNLQARQRENGAVICARQRLKVRHFTQIESIERGHRVGQLTRITIRLREVNYDEEV